MNSRSGHPRAPRRRQSRRGVAAERSPPPVVLAQSDLAKAEAEATSRQAQSGYAKSVRERAERLLALKAIPRQEYERAIADEELDWSAQRLTLLVLPMMYAWLEARISRAPR